MTRPEKLMLAVTIAFLAGAVSVRYLPLEVRYRTLVGLVEVVGAVILGVGFGFLSSRKA